MDIKTHYLTVATFRVKDKDDWLNEVTIDDHTSDKAIIRKLCICGSGIGFDEDARKWFCSESNTDLEAYCVPLLSSAELASKSGLNRQELEDPQSESLVRLDKKGELEVFLKVQAKDQWIISDPLRIFETLSIKPSETDLLMRWFLSVGGDGLTDTVDFSILWDIADPVHQKILTCLASSSNIPIYFLDASTLSMIGGQLLNPLPFTSNIVTDAFKLNASLPKDQSERQERLSCIALGQQTAHLSFSDKMGICPTIAVHLISPSKSVFELSEHIKTCPLCQGQMNL
jgi:hypothetical protein